MRQRATTELNLRQMTIRRWMLLVLLAALALAIVSNWKTTPRQAVFDPTGPLFSIDPPEWARDLDPYDPDPPEPRPLAASAASE